jgi:hypothetical protein
MYVLLISPFSSDLDPQSISCPIPARLKFTVLDTAVPSFDDRIQRWLWRYHTRSFQCLAAVACISCSLAHPACFRKAMRTLFVHTERAVVFPFRTSNVRSLIEGFPSLRFNFN